MPPGTGLLEPAVAGIYLEIYHLLWPGEAGEDADTGEGAGPGDDGLDFDGR